MELIPQRQTDDCVICCIAMATGRSYEDILAAAGGEYQPGKGTRSEYKILERLGFKNTYENGHPVGDFVSRYREWCLSPDFYRAMCWGRRALISVPSLNLEDGWHMVYSDGTNVWDPSTRKRYERFDQLQPREIILFKEGVLP